MRKNVRKLQLSRDTFRRLQEVDLRIAGQVNQPQPGSSGQGCMLNHPCSGIGMCGTMPKG
jgi:hypothetical protein